ncbi:transposase family protein [Streptomyces sp. NPDC001544]|uniref:transposase family protein n=1 Tax=Streptomyces sp. NPDC001544 TaxID=3364584 RepID=UPI0036CA899C
MRVRRPAAGRKDRDKFVSGKNKQNAVKTMVVPGGDGRVLFCSPTMPGSGVDITHARQLGLVKLLADGPAVEILADAGYQGLGAQTGGRAVTPPRALARHLGRREHMSDIVQAVAGLLSHQQTADLTSARQV